MIVIRAKAAMPSEKMRNINILDELFCFGRDALLRERS
jgi:hypothetical protein